MTQRSPFRIFAAALFTMAVGLVVTPLGAAPVNGPIRVSADGRHFVDRDGRPFFWLGDTGLAALRAIHEGPGGSVSRRPRPEGFHGRPGRARLGPRQRVREQGAARERERRQAVAERRPAHAQRRLLPPRGRSGGVGEPERARPRDAPDLGLLRQRHGRPRRQERPRLRAVAGSALQGRPQRRLGQRRRPDRHRLRGRLPRAGPRPARGRRRGPPRHLSPLRVALVVAVLPQGRLARLRHDRDLDRSGPRSTPRSWPTPCFRRESRSSSAKAPTRTAPNIPRARSRPSSCAGRPGGR